MRDADLLASCGDGLCHHCVHAESGQRDGESGEHDEENCRGPMLQRRGGEGVFERADRVPRLLRIHLGD